LKKENDDISIQVRHKTPEDILDFCEDKKKANDNFMNLSKHSRYEAIESNLNSNRDEYENRYSNVYLIMNGQSEDNIYKLVHKSEAVEELDKNFVNLVEYPYARTYLLGKVVGKLGHLPYELTNYRLRTPVFNECITILSQVLKQTLGDAYRDTSWLKKINFWMWYHIKAQIADKSSFNAKINESVMEDLRATERIYYNLLTGDDGNGSDGSDSSFELSE
tara:strand:+ start:118 stop:777 length:660 start_codon:yes stop_codon:yes gene_type:complete